MFVHFRGKDRQMAARRAAEIYLERANTHAGRPDFSAPWPVQELSCGLAGSIGEVASEKFVRIVDSNAIFNFSGVGAEDVVLSNGRTLSISTSTSQNELCRRNLREWTRERLTSSPVLLVVAPKAQAYPRTVSDLRRWGTEDPKSLALLSALSYKLLPCCPPPALCVELVAVVFREELPSIVREKEGEEERPYAFIPASSLTLEMRDVEGRLRSLVSLPKV